CEQRDPKSLPDGIKVQLREVRPDKDFPTGEEQAQAPGLGDLVDQGLEPGQAQLALAHGGRPRGLVDVAVNAVEVAAEGRLDRSLDGQAALLGAHLAEQLFEGYLGDGRAAHPSFRWSCW